MLQLGVLTGINLDKKLLYQLVRQKCDRAKTTDAAHSGNLPVPNEDEAWRRLFTDVSAKFNTMSIHGIYDQMAIIGAKTSMSGTTTWKLRIRYSRRSRNGQRRKYNSFVVKTHQDLR
jgi:hypothetical protein